MIWSQEDMILSQHNHTAGINLLFRFCFSMFFTENQNIFMKEFKTEYSGYNDERHFCFYWFASCMELQY